MRLCPLQHSYCIAYTSVLTCSVAQSCPIHCEPSRLFLLCPRNFSGKNTGVGCYFLLQGIFPTQGSNPCLLCFLHWQVDSLHFGLKSQAIYDFLSTQLCLLNSEKMLGSIEFLCTYSDLTTYSSKLGK